MAAAVATEPLSPQSMDPLPSRPGSGTDPSDRRFSSSPSKQLDIQDQQYLKSEEYRQLFRLPPDEVLIQDFNCALQENFLLQGHMYLFDHYICFYSNLFGFETKKIIPFHEVTAVRRAKAAAIFPTAIEVIAEGKKYFFTSFLSRDEAFNLINDGWLLHGNASKIITDQQESISEISSSENGSTRGERVKISRSSSSIGEGAESSRPSVDGFDLVERDKDVSIAEEIEPPAIVEPEMGSSSGLQASVVENAEIVQSTESSPSEDSLAWKQEDSDAPKVPECFTKVAESKFQIKVEEFFNFFFSDDAVDFQESFHKKCGDKEFRCTSWRPHEKFGHTRDVSFQHPIKIYFGARFGSCQELQKYRVYKNSHLIVETSQEISDVPYGDYFRVEGLWDVERVASESKDGCILRVYTNVAFSKNTMWKGKIVQSTVEECREAYATWINLAHEFLKKRILQQGAGSQEANVILNNQINLERQAKVEENSKISREANDSRMSERPPDQAVHNQQDSFGAPPSVASSFLDSISKMSSSFRGQSQVSLLLVVTVAVVLVLMQISILVLLSKPQQIHVIPRGDYASGMYMRNDIGPERVALLDKQIDHLKEEMHMVESLLDKMRREYALLKVKLEDLELHRKRRS